MIKRFEEYIDSGLNEGIDGVQISSNEEHRLDEMAKISRGYDQLPKNAEVWVYGENDIQGTKTPHFHLKIYNGDIELEIFIENITEMNIWRTKGNYPKSWNNITDVRDAVIKWLRQRNKKKKTLYNWEIVVMEWNNCNTTNEIEDEFAMPNCNG